MSEARFWSAAAFIPKEGWIITGGNAGGGRRLSTAEQTRDGRNFSSFTPLPLALDSHCLVSLDDEGVSGDLFLTGGNDSNADKSKKSFLYKSGNWRPVADMPTAREGKEEAQFRNEQNAE